MNFLFQQYTEVYFWQLALPWAALVLFICLGVWGWVIAIDQKNMADINGEVVGLYLANNSKLQKMFKDANEKVISLNAQISRLTVRPRGKNGKFEKAKK
jgi:hypothetical protein